LIIKFKIFGHAGPGRRDVTFPTLIGKEMEFHENLGQFEELFVGIDLATEFRGIRF
jgi:hypothetical protein